VGSCDGVGCPRGNLEVKGDREHEL
jgi:hypothetical protein